MGSYSVCPVLNLIMFATIFHILGIYFIVTVLFICYALTINSGSMLGLKCITTLCTLKKVSVPDIMIFDVFIVTEFVVFLAK